MKMEFVAALAVAITGQVLYHVTQKSVAAGAHPVLSLLVFYGVAALFTLPLFWLFPLGQPLGDEASRINWAVIGVGASIVLIEIGFLLAYRAGGNLSSAFVLTAAAVTSCLAVVGVAVFKEALDLRQLAGIGLCLAGIWLVSGKAA
jgi:drug/metabolite transporter (DMT)-like permease